MPSAAKPCSDYTPPAGAASKPSAEDHWHIKRYQVSHGVRAFCLRFEAGFGRFPWLAWAIHADLYDHGFGGCRDNERWPELGGYGLLRTVSAPREVTFQLKASV